MTQKTQRSLLASVTLVMLTAFFVGSQLNADDDSPQVINPVLRIGLVDTGRLTKQSKIFKNGLAAISAVAAELGQERAMKDDALKKLSNLYDSMEEQNTPEDLDAEFALAKERNKVRQLADAQKQRLEQMQVELFAELIKATREEIRHYAEENGISLVLNYNASRIGELNTEGVKHAMTATVIYQNGIDITDDILQRLNARTD